MPGPARGSAFLRGSRQLGVGVWKPVEGLGFLTAAPSPSVSTLPGTSHAAGVPGPCVHGGLPAPRAPVCSLTSAVRKSGHGGGLVWEMQQERSCFSLTLSVCLAFCVEW